MPRAKTPRRGSMQFWQRRRSHRSYARVRSWPAAKDAKPMGFAGYKVGMTHLIITNNSKTSITKGMDISCPVTIIECPPIKISSIRFYKNDIHGNRAITEILAQNHDKELGRKLCLPKKQQERQVPQDFDYIHLLVHTQPKLTGIGNKKPEVFEIAIGGKKEDQLRYAQEKLGKELTVQEVFKPGQHVDIHGVTKGKGLQGPVRRFGINLRSHKSEKTRRAPGSLGGWQGQGHLMWRKAKAGKMGFHVRTEYNKWIVKIGDAKDLQKNGGFEHYGVVKNNYLFLKGSISGPQKRIVRLNEPMRPNNKIPTETPLIKHVNI